MFCWFPVVFSASRYFLSSFLDDSLATGSNTLFYNFSSFDVFDFPPFLSPVAGFLLLNSNMKILFQVRQKLPLLRWMLAGVPVAIPGTHRWLWWSTPTSFEADDHSIWPPLLFVDTGVKSLSVIQSFSFSWREYKLTLFEVFVSPLSCTSQCLGRPVPLFTLQEIVCLLARTTDFLVELPAHSFLFPSDWGGYNKTPMVFTV